MKEDPVQWLEKECRSTTGCDVLTMGNKNENKIKWNGCNHLAKA